MAESMNEQDDATRRSYNRYIMEVMQMEWEQDEARRQLMASTHSCDMMGATEEGRLREPCDACAREHAEWLGDHGQVQHTVPEQRGANAPVTVADVNMTGHGHDVKPVGRPFTYPSGVVADGWAEYMTTCLCWSCDLEAEYAGYCEAHYDQWLEEQALGQLEDQQQEWDEEWDDLMSGEELERAQREREEGHNDH